MLNFTKKETIFCHMKQIYIRITTLLFLLLATLACQKKENYPIPNLPVNIFINLNLPAYQNLNNPGGWAYVNGGSKGIVVYRNFDEFVALDRHTTVHPDSNCAIAVVDSVNVFILNDPCSDAQYSITTGTVLSEPAQWPLRQYFTSWDQAYSLQITN